MEKKEKSLVLKLSDEEYAEMKKYAADFNISTRTYGEMFIKNLLKEARATKKTPNPLDFIKNILGKLA